MLRSDREKEREGAIKLFISQWKFLEILEKPGIIREAIVYSLYDSWFTTRCIPIKTTLELLDTVWFAIRSFFRLGRQLGKFRQFPPSVNFGETEIKRNH